MARHGINDHAFNEDAASEEDSEENDAVGALIDGDELKSDRKRPKTGSSSQPHHHRRRQSEVWRFYDRHPDGAKTCKVCQKHFSTNTATGALRKHLEKHFGEQTDQVLSTAQTAMEVTISPSTNTVTVTGLAPVPNLQANGTSTPPAKRKLAQGPIAPVATLSVGPHSATVTGTALPSRSRYKSAVWTWFSRLEDGRPQCQSCGKIYSTTASTSGLQRHIDHHERRNEPINEHFAMMESQPENGIPKQEPRSDASPSLPPSAPTTPVTALSKPKPAPRSMLAHPQAEDTFLKSVVHQHIPLSEIAESLSLMYRSCTGKSPDVPAMEGKLREWYTRKLEDVKRFLVECTSRASVSMELWTSANEQVFLIVTAHVMSEKWQPIRFVLDCVLVSPDVTAESIKDHLNAVVFSIGLTDKISAVTTGDDRAMEAFNQFKLQASLKAGPAISHVRCVGWCLTVCVQPSLDHVKDHINKVRRFLKMLMNARKTTDLSNIAGLLLHDYQEIKLDTPGLWTSTVDMLDCAVKMRPVIDDFITRNGTAYGDFSEDDWRILELTVELTSNFQLAALDIGKTDYPTLSNVLPIMEYLTHGLTQQKDCADYPTWWRKLAREMLERTQKVMQQLFTDVYFFGTVLDPRHKLSTIPQQVSRQSIEENLRVTFARYLQPVSSAGLTTPSGSGSSNSKTGSLMSAILKKNRESLTQPNIDELNQYLNTAVEQPDVDPLEWWESHKKLYPNLALMAKDYLCIPATSSPSDQLFVKERRVGRLRNRLDEEELVLYTCLNSWNAAELGSRMPVSAGNTTFSVKKEF